MGKNLTMSVMQDTTLLAMLLYINQGFVCSTALVVGVRFEGQENVMMFRLHCYVTDIYALMLHKTAWVQLDH